MSEFFNADEVRKAIAILKPNDQLFECRILKGKKTFSGYFKSAEKLIEELEHLSLKGTNVYITLNTINEACYSRLQRDRFCENQATTSDADVVGYQWMLIDLDPERATGVSSSKEELKASGELAGKVYEYLKGLGFEEPVKAKSGNGYHILYRISLANTAENAELVHRCLDVLSNLFSTDAVKVDTVNYNPSRICKLHGTLAQKGASTQDRPHRMSKIFSDSLDLKITPKVFLQKLAEQIPQNPKPQRQTTYQYQPFDLEEFLHKNGIGYEERRNSGRDSSTIYALDECPFDSNHKNGDAKIFKYPDGAISFRCHHNSCSRYTWKDLRLKFDPTAYDRKEIDTKYEDGWKQHNRNIQQAQQDEEEPEKLFRTAREIYEDTEPDHEFVRSGIEKIDEVMHGLEKQCISIISGLRGSGKSTIIGNIILNAVNDDHNVVVYSGELANKKYLSWIMRQAAGKNGVEVSTNYQNGVGVPQETEKKIVNWMGNRFWLYNNRCGNNFRKIANSLRTILKQTQADICIIDNLMALDLANVDSDKYEAQTKFVLELKDIAIDTNTHIICVAHPRKANGFIRLDDISGSGNIGNAIDNAFMIHRCNHDFKKHFKEFFSADPFQFGIDDDATNVIEIAKDRENGTMDMFIPLYFEQDTKRLRNSKDEYIHYGWEYSDGLQAPQFVPVETDDELPFI